MNGQSDVGLSIRLRFDDRNVDCDIAGDFSGLSVLGSRQIHGRTHRQAIQRFPLLNVFSSSIVSRAFSARSHATSPSNASNFCLTFASAGTFFNDVATMPTAALLPA